MFKKILVTILLMGLFVFFQVSVLSNVFELKTIPNLVLITLVYFSFSKGSWVGQISGFIIGILLDVISLAPLGYYAILLTLTGYIAGIFSKLMNSDKLLFPMITIFISSNLFLLLGNVILIVFRFDNVLSWPNNLYYWKVIGLNTILAPILFVIFSFIDKKVLPERQSL
ncbi:rod shape-determining protein MreD [Spirochaeta cellobiosiphila]|uniref:rod shape-determining protein MreD n=1 Tax=Spirochaeta cellobiosiphila TaxID=504483 RepID=UPI00048AAA3D|nr:rod shape-determining protein MreD [Spirochaeta cellobiosiphila]